MEIRFQLEIFKSQLGEYQSFVSGKAFYFKKDGKWQMDSRPSYDSPGNRNRFARPTIQY